MYDKHKIIIAGAGGIGRAAGLMLADQHDFDCDIFIGDSDETLAAHVADWITKGTASLVHVEPFKIHTSECTDLMDYVFKSGDIILDCLPGSQAPRLATFALKYKLHYVNLTEYVAETKQIMELAANADTGFILQAGLAPGYINILAHHLYKTFVKEIGSTVHHIEMKVGALTKTTSEPHYYGFTWSPIGVATEYVKDAIVLKNGEICSIPALSDTKKLLIDGVVYEDDYTSGGAADLPDFFKGKVEHLDYKTIRYPGHYAWVKQLLENIPDDEARADKLLSKMSEIIPFNDVDTIILYVSVKGKNKAGQLHIMERHMQIDPIKYGNHLLKAIQVTTAAPLLECARMLLSNKYKGVILQSQIETEEFLDGMFITQVYNNKKAKLTAVQS